LPVELGGFGNDGVTPFVVVCRLCPGQIVSPFLLVRGNLA
jgi:hypothetical protein